MELEEGDIRIKEDLEVQAEAEGFSLNEEDSEEIQTEEVLEVIEVEVVLIEVEEEATRIILIMKIDETLTKKDLKDSMNTKERMNTRKNTRQKRIIEDLIIILERSSMKIDR